MFLIVTNEQDLTSDYIVLELKKRGLPFFRFNTEDLTKSKVFFDPEGGWVFSLEGHEIVFSEIKAGYFRRPGAIQLPSSIKGKNEIKYCSGEWNSVLLSALSSLGECWLNKPSSIQLAEDKPRQLSLAFQLGFKIPKTVITNDAIRATDFTSNKACVAKPIKEALLDGEAKEKVIFTNRLQRDTVFDEASLSLSPIILQSEILKKSDIRATVIGDAVYAVEISSQELKETEVDWRRGEHTELEHTEHFLPNEINQKCISITKKLELRFGAVDLVLDQFGEYWFLEINPNGQWAWLENRADLPLTKAIVDELERIADVCTH